MKFKVIFLDVDGVLVDSEKVFNVCWRKAAEEEGYEMTFEQALELRSLDSTLAKGLFMTWYGHEEAYSVIRQRRKILMNEYINHNQLNAKPGLSKLLTEAKSNNLKVAIVTSSPLVRITEYLSSVGIGIRDFAGVITTEQVKQGKPYPDVYLYACKQLGLEPRQCIAVEDSPNGVKSAYAAGCYTVMIPDLTPMTDDLKKYVHVLSNNLGDVMNLLK